MKRKAERAPSRTSGGSSRKSLLVGVLGGIASGKSRVAELLAGTDGWVISADLLAHEALSSPEGIEFLRGRFGPRALDEQGRPRRGALAELAFEQPAGNDARSALEGWIHPRVRARIMERLGEARDSAVPIVVLDVPLLLENDDEHGLAGLCDTLVFVDTDVAERERRARLSRGWEQGEIERRESVQLPLDLKRARADHVLKNNGSLEDLERAARALRRELL